MTGAHEEIRPAPALEILPAGRIRLIETVLPELSGRHRVRRYAEA
ncbi:hypothetical protein [Streptomyces roseochromogenus]|uniref:Uncharacterized protein n=1 Tax=Streptomyces roseochromogenus subsp. oscitans DS 12.976 TaxID=1352936 RepID=V6JKM9_STRRC|nr:hypothetical protein [Streptomyces roseochromogenus]EST20268.1 hypothetical protein M878_39975 [Streptomyces roseochromogenus subsp. oscitans DS 12.976]